MKTVATLLAWAFYAALSYCFMIAWLEVTPGGLTWILGGIAVAGVMCWLIAQVSKES